MAEAEYGQGDRVQLIQTDTIQEHFSGNLIKITIQQTSLICLCFSFLDKRCLKN